MAEISRRGCLVGLGAGAMACVGVAAGQEEPSLSAIARARGIRYGAAPFSYPRVSTPAYDRLIIAQCSMIAPVLNWKAISPAPGEFRAGTDEGVVAFARTHGLDLTGMHLLWHEVVPSWFAGLADAADARNEIEGHIARMGAAHADATWSVNVINEALDPRAGRADGLRHDAFAARLGNSYFDIAFSAARRAFPRSLLLYNDYGMEQDAGNMVAKRAALLGRLDALQAAGTPIDGIGLQAHLTLARPFDAVSYATFLQEIAARRVRIVITELDVLDAIAPAATDTRDRAVADLYRRYLGTALGNDAVAGVVTWGLSDRWTWLTATSGPQFARADGLPTRPLPFDDDLQPKPAYFAIRDSFGEAVPRRLY